jgi:hypothetical protein
MDWILHICLPPLNWLYLVNQPCSAVCTHALTFWISILNFVFRSSNTLNTKIHNFPILWRTAVFLQANVQKRTQKDAGTIHFMFKGVGPPKMVRKKACAEL